MMKQLSNVKLVHKNLSKNVKGYPPSDKCKYHPNGYLVVDISSGNLVCDQCGVVAADRVISEEAEWRSFGNDTFAEKQAKSRVGQAENPFLDNDLGTAISKVDKNGNSTTSFGSSIEKQYKRRTIDSALTSAFRSIDEAGSRISLPESVLYRAKSLYNDFYRKSNLKGNIMFLDAKVGACLYVACIKESCPRTVREICAITGISKHDTTKAISKMCKVLKITLNMDSTEMISRFCTDLNLPKDKFKLVVKQAREYASKIAEQQLSRKLYPESIAGAAIYLATQSEDMAKYYQMTKKIVGSVVGVAANTIARSTKYVQTQIDVNQSN